MKIGKTLKKVKHREKLSKMLKSGPNELEYGSNIYLSKENYKNDDNTT